LLQGVHHRQRWIGGRGKKLENAQLPGCEANAVSKRAAGVNGYAQVGPLSSRDFTEPWGGEHRMLEL
jgi:hypothetical protein